MREPEHIWTKEGEIDDYTILVVYDHDEWLGPMFEAVIINEHGDSVLSYTFNSEDEAVFLIKRWFRDHKIEGTLTLRRVK